MVGPNYLVTESDNTKVNANRGECNAWETYRIEDKGNGMYAIKNTRRRSYLSCQPDGRLQGKGAKSGTWERFKIIKNNDNTVFQCAEHGQDTFKPITAVVAKQRKRASCRQLGKFFIGSKIVRNLAYIARRGVRVPRHQRPVPSLRAANFWTNNDPRRLFHVILDRRQVRHRTMLFQSAHETCPSGSTPTK